MRNIIREAPSVAEGFFSLTRNIRDYSPLDEKQNELILIGIFTAHRGLRGLETHIERASNAGATREEVLASILLALPVIGITDVTMAVDQALKTLEQVEEQKKQERQDAATH